jgi:S-adenosylmethionine:tRNA-ribosyltransferase-isomerase (queuine synthetase)
MVSESNRSDLNTSGRLLEFQRHPGRSFWDMLEEYGHIPFPLRHRIRGGRRPLSNSLR